MLEIPDLPAELKRRVMVTWHWTGGTYGVEHDRDFYHFVIDRLGGVHQGVPVLRNMGRLKASYAPHVKKGNTNNIGISLAGMGDSSQTQAKQGKYGSFPLTAAQVERLVELTALIARRYGIPVDPQRMLCHSEWPTVKKIPQSGKWDINYLPHLDLREKLHGNGTQEVGNWLRREVSSALGARATPVPPDATDHTEQEQLAWSHFLAFYDLAHAAGFPAATLSEIDRLRAMPPLKGYRR
jgi:hypothetical protein